MRRAASPGDRLGRRTIQTFHKENSNQNLIYRRPRPYIKLPVIRGKREPQILGDLRRGVELKMLLARGAFNIYESKKYALVYE